MENFPPNANFCAHLAQNRFGTIAMYPKQTWFSILLLHLSVRDFLWFSILLPNLSVRDFLFMSYFKYKTDSRASCHCSYSTKTSSWLWHFLCLIQLLVLAFKLIHNFPFWFTHVTQWIFWPSPSTGKLWSCPGVQIRRGRLDDDDCLDDKDVYS